MDKFESRCLCGAVRFTATDRPKSVFWCHCQSRRRSLVGFGDHAIAGLFSPFTFPAIAPAGLMS
jgi:hypothetical protein